MAATVELVGVSTAAAEVAREVEGRVLPDLLFGMAEVVAEDARRDAPVRTGRFRNAIEAVRDGSGAIVQIPVSYARMVHRAGVDVPAYHELVIGPLVQDPVGIARRVGGPIG